MPTVLVAGESDPLAEAALRCAGHLPGPVVAWVDEGRLVVDETMPERLRRVLAELAPDRRPARIVLAPLDGPEGVDPFGPDPFVQSATFLTASAALEAGVGVALVTRGVPARGFFPLFARYPGRAVAHVAVAPAEFEPPGAAADSARIAGIAALAASGVSTWLRLDPVVPVLSDRDEQLRALLQPAAVAGARGVVVAPLELTDERRDALAERPGVLDYYRPGRRPRRGAVPVAPERFLPLEREAALLWRVRTVAQDLGLAVRLCRCARSVTGACGLAVPTPPALAPVQEGQLSIFNTRTAG